MSDYVPPFTIPYGEESEGPVPWPEYVPPFTGEGEATTTTTTTAAATTTTTTTGAARGKRK